MTEPPIPVPATLACATCGKPLSALTCYSVSVPLDGPVKPVDLCNPWCLLEWSSNAVASLKRDIN